MVARAVACRRGGDRDRFSRRAEVRLPARCPGSAASWRRHRLPHGAGRLRQVLLVLRGAVYARRRGQPAGGLGAGGSSPDGAAGRARDHVAGPERERLSRQWSARRHLEPGPAAAGRCPRSLASPACATPPPTRATWTTNWSRRTAACRSLMPFLHLPVQSGSDRMLAAMNRGHDAASYRALVGRLRQARPDLALSSDFIVGHPGETEADFEGDAGPGARDRLRAGVLLQVFGPARDARCPGPPTPCRSRSRTSACNACRR